MKHVLILLTLLGMAGAASAATIADWRFEEGADGVTWSGDHDNHYLDDSGNGNHMSAWSSSMNPTATSDVPFANQGSTTNELALEFNGWNTNNTNVGTWEWEDAGETNDVSVKMIDSYDFATGWTIEATFKADSHFWGTIVGKDGQPAGDGVVGLGFPNFHMKVRDDDKTIDCGFFDSATNNYSLRTEPIELGRWYSVAIAYDPATTNCSLYVKQQDGGDYVLQVSTNMTLEADLNLETGFWRVGNGMWEGNPVKDFFDGIIDEVKISDTALTPAEFVNQDGFTIPFDIEKPFAVAANGFIDWIAPFDLTASEYWSPAGEAFGASDWQISTDDTFATIDWAASIGTPTITVPGSTLAEGTYYARVRYVSDDGITASEWSDAYLLNLHVAQTVAYWRFEELADGQRHDSDQDDFYQDASGNGNHLSSWWTPSRPSYVDDVPATLALDQANNTAIDFYRSSDIATFTDVGSTGPKPVNDLSFTNGWTVEASFTVRDWLWETVVAKEGKIGDMPGAITTDWQNLMTPFQFKVCGDPVWLEYGKIGCLFSTDAGEAQWLWTQDQVQIGKWYSIAATCNGTDVKLYLKTAGDDEYVFQGSISVPDGVTFDFWSGRQWAVGRGMWDNGASDFWNGTVDEVRISDAALHPSKFIHQTDEFGGYDVKTPDNVNLVSFTGWNTPVRVTASEFYSPRGYSHAASQWQLSTDAGFASIAWDSGAISGSNFVDIPAGSLAPATYYVRVGYQANGTWAWSDVYPMDITTIAHWRFEEGPNGAAQASAADSSFFGNNLTQGTVAYQPTATNDVSFSTVPQSWDANDLALSCTGGDRGMTSAGADLNTYAFINGWTVECTFKFDAIWWQIIMSKTGHRNGVDWEMPFWFKTRDFDKHLEVLYTRHETSTFDSFGVAETLAPIEVGKWYSVAAVFDNETIKLYLKGEGDSEYVLQRAYNENYPSALAFVADYPAEWMIGAGTGVWDGNPATEAPIDFFNGIVDEIKISNVALQPGGFIADIGAGWDSDSNGMADVWEIDNFGAIGVDPSDDPDGDGLSNLAEYRNGGNPNDINDTGYASWTGSFDAGTGTNVFEYVYPRRRYPYSGDALASFETTDDLIYGTWTNDGSVVISGIGLLDNEFDAVTNQVPMDTNEKFIKRIEE